MYVLFTVMSVFFFFFPFPIFKDTIYIRVPQRTDPLMFTLFTHICCSRASLNIILDLIVPHADCHQRCGNVLTLRLIMVLMDAETEDNQKFAVCVDC